VNAVGRAAASLCLVWLAAGLSGADARQQAAARTSNAPSIEVTRVGSVDVEDQRRVDLADATVDLAGQAWSFRRGDRVAILVRPLGQGPWSMAGEDEAPPGGLFQIAGIRFPETASYELIACLVPAGGLPAGGRPSTAPCGDKALAASRKLLVRVAARPQRLAAERPDLEVLTVGGVTVDPRGPTPVPARGEVVLRARGVAPGTRVNLLVLAPYSDRCYLHGPARQGPQRGLFTMHGVPLEVPGDPRGAHLELVAVASPELLAAGLMSFGSFARRDARTSPAVEVIVDRKWEAGDSARVPQLAVTRIGDQEVPRGTRASPLEVEPGDAVEIGQYERVPEGARVYVLIRPRGSSSWLVQGPAVPRGSPSPVDPLQGPPRVTWLWPSARFEPADTGETRPQELRRDEFEVLAVLSTSSLPQGWIDSAALSGAFVQTVSRLVRVSVLPAKATPDPQLTIARLGSREADPDAETPVGAAEEVEVETAKALPSPLRLYLARHKVGSSLWTLAEAIPRGTSHLVPALSFINPHPQEGARYQLIAIATRGVLPVEQLDYSELVHTAVASSPVVTVRYEPGGGRGAGARLRKGLQAMSSLSWSGMLWALLLVALVAAALLALLAFLAVLQWSLGVVSQLAESAAGRIKAALAASRLSFSTPREINPAHFLLGIVLAAIMVFALGRYIPLYAMAVAHVTGLPARKSAAMALWVVLLTAFTGTFIELSSERAAAPAGQPESSHAFLLRFALLVLVLFQGFFYGAFLSQTADGLVSILGGFAFALFAFIEATAFLFITRLTLAPAGALAVRLFHAPLVLAELSLRFVAKLFAAIPRKKPQPPPPSVGSARDLEEVRS
jgi:hypothetical protein